MTKKKQQYTFKKKRDFKLITPCCGSSNKDGKFVNYNELPNNYGYCHSCGKITTPPAVYLNEKEDEFIWHDTLRKYEPLMLVTTTNNLQQEQQSTLKYISEEIIWEQYQQKPENNLLKYLRNTYSDEVVENAKFLYVLGTTKDGGTVFWNINKETQVQKNKISYYTIYGKRTNKFKVPYKNEDGYHACLFGEHLLIDEYKESDIVILVESEKTAIVGHINLPNYTWIAYGGLNGLTDTKLKPLIGYTVLLVPDISNRAVKVMRDKLPKLRRMGINANVWDMTAGKTDKELKQEKIYNNDLEDFFRKIKNSSI